MSPVRVSSRRPLISLMILFFAFFASSPPPEIEYWMPERTIMRTPTRAAR